MNRVLAAVNDHSFTADSNTTTENSAVIDTDTIKAQQPQQQQRRRNGVGRGNDAKTTLPSLLKYMEGYEIIVELKSGKRHRGFLTSADDNMNMMLKMIGATVGREEEIDDSYRFDRSDAAAAGSIIDVDMECTVRGSNVRYIHFPDNANLSTIVRTGRQREWDAKKRYQKTKRKSTTPS